MQQHRWLRPAWWSKLGNCGWKPESSSIKGLRWWFQLASSEAGCHFLSQLPSQRQNYGFQSGFPAPWGRFLLCPSLVFCLTRGKMHQDACFCRYFLPQQVMTKHPETLPWPEIAALFSHKRGQGLYLKAANTNFKHFSCRAKYNAKEFNSNWQQPLGGAM